MRKGTWFKAYLTVADDAVMAENNVRAYACFSEKTELKTQVHDVFLFPVSSCEHPKKRLVFWQVGEETSNTPGRYVRCYRCLGCDLYVHDDAQDGHMVPCNHEPHRPLLKKDVVWQ